MTFGFNNNHLSQLNHNHNIGAMWPQTSISIHLGNWVTPPYKMESRIIISNFNSSINPSWPRYLKSISTKGGPKYANPKWSFKVSWFQLPTSKRMWNIWFEEGECKIRCGSCNYIFELEKKKKKLVEKLIIL